MKYYILCSWWFFSPSVSDLFSECDTAFNCYNRYMGSLFPISHIFPEITQVQRIPFTRYSKYDFEIRIHGQLYIQILNLLRIWSMCMDFLWRYVKPRGNGSCHITNLKGIINITGHEASDAILLAAILISATYPRLQKHEYHSKTNSTTNSIFLRSRVCLDLVGGHEGNLWGLFEGKVPCDLKITLLWGLGDGQWRLWELVVKKTW